MSDNESNNNGTPAAVITHGQTLGEWQASAERVPVFEILTLDPETGESVSKVYTMPSKPNAGLGLRYLKLARRQAADVAMSWLLETAIGVDAYDDLADEPDLTGDDLQAIIAKVQKIALGGLESPKGS